MIAFHSLGETPSDGTEMRTTHRTTPDVQFGSPRPLVVKLGGAALDRDPDAAPVFDALAALHRAESAGVILVHGGGKLVDRRMEALGMVSERREGVRITPPEHVEEVVATLAGIVNTHVVGELSSRGCAAVGLSLADGFVARCTVADQYDFDPGRVGKVVGGSARLVDAMLRAGFLPVFSSIGSDAQGRALNINADDAAAAMAGIAAARMLVLLTDVPGVMDGNKRVLATLTEEEIEGRIASGEIANGMIPKVRGALRAARAAGAPAAIASWHEPESLVRLAHGETVGTLVLPPEDGSRGVEVVSSATTGAGA